MQHAQAEIEPGQPRKELIEETLEELAQTFDFRWGGFGRAPKFPNAGGLDLLLEQWAERGTEWARRIVSETLHAMGKGGVYDQLGGGFHRYSTDARWIIPHFEKMAYDNGPLLATYSAAHGAFSDPFLAELASGIVRYYEDITPELIRVGGFPASQDADFSPDDDGDYWTWTEAEMSAVLQDDGEFTAARLYFGLSDDAGAMHIDPARHVLFRAQDEETIAKTMDTQAGEVTQLLARARARLKAARDERPRPYVDTTVYSGWSALVASGHLAAARYAGVEGARDTALRALDRIWKDAFVSGRGVQHRVNDADSGEALEDQAFVLLAFLDAFEITQQRSWLDRASELAGVLRTRFADANSGAFRDRPLDAAAAVATLERPYLPLSDSPTPSGNGAAALGLFRLAAYTGDEHARNTALGVLHAFAGSASRLLSSAATWMKALAWAVRPVTSVVVIDRARTAAESELFAAALRTFRPRTTVRWLHNADEASDALPRELKAMITGDSPRAYLCAGHVCAAPVQSAEDLTLLMRTFT
jgi:uncharacterized protein YyaL (SSP411 family)